MMQYMIYASLHQTVLFYRSIRQNFYPLFFHKSYWALASLHKFGIHVYCTVTHSSHTGSFDSQFI